MRRVDVPFATVKREIGAKILVCRPARDVEARQVRVAVRVEQQCATISPLQLRWIVPTTFVTLNAAKASSAHTAASPMPSPCIGISRVGALAAHSVHPTCAGGPSSTAQAA
jgi:hypothetical protein